MDLKDQKIAVLGAGREGQSTARYLLQHEAAVTVCDREPRPPARQSLGDQVRWQTGAKYLDRLTDFDLVFRTPALPVATPELQQALADGVEISSQTKYFFADCPCPIIGISGTKGKGTTAELLAAMLEAGGRRVKLGGNIGTPPLDFLDELGPDNLVVLELSSFQLQDLDQSPETAILTNLTADHLDYHRDIAEYHGAKAPLLKFQRDDDLAIINADDPGSQELAKLAGGLVQRFSLTAPAEAMVSDGQLQVLGQPVCALDDIPLPGPHNQRNVLAAALAAGRYGVPPAKIRQAIKAYRTRPYHLELVGSKQQIRYFNDSYATNQTATIPAIESFTEPIVLICGGHDKGLPYDELAATIVAGPVKALVLIDPVGSRIKQAVVKAAGKGKAPAMTTIDRREEILPAARAFTEPGDVVLFSPAAASFGWFDNYRDRGAFFTAAVEKMA